MRNTVACWRRQTKELIGGSRPFSDFCDHVSEQQKGRELFSHACNLCHTLAASNAVGRIGPNLDVLIPEVSSTTAGRKAFILSAILEGRARGNGQMPALLFQGKEAEDVANYVATVAGH